jgi:hypothetical protein
MADNLNEFKKNISDLKKQMNDLLKEAGGDALARAAIKADKPYKALIAQLKEINSQVLEVKATTKDYTDRLIQQQSSAKKLTGIYTQLGKLDLKRVEKQAGALKMDADKVKQFEKISNLNQQLAQLSAEDSISKQLIQKEIQNELKDLEGSRGIHSHIVKNLKQQYDFANNISSLTEGQKEQLQAQVEVYEKIKKSIGGIFDTLSILTSGPAGFFGTALIGAGFAADKLGKNIRSFGGFIDSAQFSALGLSFIFDDAEETAKGLAKEFGGLKDVTLSTQLNTNLMATNMGISGQEAASVVGSFARLNNGSADTAMNMAATTKEMAKAAGVPVDSVMKDVAGSAQAFAEYGKDGGLNIAKAAVSAAKLGVGMDSLTKVTDSLLDFETSINQELELGAMLGKNINLDRARALAYEGNIGGAVKETLQSLGGIEEFNKMDIFQKRKAAELLGLSVDEFQKMAANSDKLNDDGTVQLSTFDSITEAITASATASGGFLKTMGGLVLGAAQMGGSFAQMGMDVKGMASNIPGLGKLFGGGKAPTPPVPTVTTPTLPEGGAPGGGMMESMSKINMNDVLKGAAALVIVAAAVFVFGKAVQEFMKVSWEAVGMAVVSMLALVGAISLLGVIMSSGVGAVAILAGAAAMLIVAAAVLVLGFAIQAIGKGFEMLGAGIATLVPNLIGVGGAIASLVMFIPAIALLSLALIGLSGAMFILGATAPFMMIAGAGLMLLGLGLQLIGAGLSAVSAALPSMVEQISTLSTINFLPILGLAGALTVLSIALAAVAVSGMMALPALLALGLIAGGAAALMGGGEGEGGDRTGELIDEIKGLRADLIAGKIAVNIDGQKVTSNVGKVVARNSSNSYAKV